MLVEEGQQILAVRYLVKKLRMGGCVRVEVSSDVEIVSCTQLYACIWG
jgi:hypothetical protein